MTKPITPKPGQFIEITARHCGSLQPDVHVGDRFAVKAISQTKSGATTLIASYKANRSGEIRLNSDRFSWSILTPEMMADEQFRKVVQEDSRKIMQCLTEQEHLDIALVPLIYNQIAWTYAFRAIDLSVQYRVEILKKLTRSVRECRRSYINFIRLDLPQRNIDHIENEAQRFLDTFAADMTTLYFTINGVFKKFYPNYPYDDLRTNAIISMLIIKLAEVHIRETDKVIRRKLGPGKDTVMQPTIKSLYTYMEAFAGIDRRFDFFDPNVQLCIKILSLNFKNIQFQFPPNN